MIIMEKRQIRGIPIDVYWSAEIRASDIPGPVKHALYNHIESMDERFACGEMPQKWCASTVGYNSGKNKKELVILNSGNEKLKNPSNILAHEDTHVYFGRKCKNSDKTLEEAVAFARQAIYGNRDDGEEDVPIETIAGVYEKESLKKDAFVNAAITYFYAANEIGDDAALSMMKDAMNDGGDILKNFEKKVTGYKAGLLSIFN
jgi:hypothetical protein